jgi:hypothetical protein
VRRFKAIAVAAVLIPEIMVIAAMFAPAVIVVAVSVAPCEIIIAPFSVTVTIVVTSGDDQQQDRSNQKAGGCCSFHVCSRTMQDAELADSQLEKRHARIDHGKVQPIARRSTQSLSAPMQTHELGIG